MYRGYRGYIVLYRVIFGFLEVYRFMNGFYKRVYMGLGFGGSGYVFFGLEFGVQGLWFKFRV